MVPLADALRRAGLKVWLDRQELRIGDSLREKIDQGLAESRFGIVILSQHFLQKRWPLRELNGLMALEDDGQKVILPVWHEITKSELAKYSPVLADRLAANTSEGIDNVCRAILDVVLAPDAGSPSLLSPSRVRCLSALLDRNAGLSEIVDFLSAHPAIILQSIPMTPLMFQDFVLADVAFRQATVPFIIVCGTMARTFPGVVLVDFANPYGRLMENGQLTADVAARLVSIRGAIDQIKAEPLSPVQPSWNTRSPSRSSRTYSEIWRSTFTGAVAVTRDESRRAKSVNDGQVVLVEAVVFAGRRGDRSDFDRNYLAQMTGDIVIHSYDRLLEQAMMVDGDFGP